MLLVECTLNRESNLEREFLTSISNKFGKREKLTEIF